MIYNDILLGWHKLSGIITTSELENSNKLPRFETLIKIILALGIPIKMAFLNKFKECKYLENQIDTRREHESIIYSTSLT